MTPRPRLEIEAEGIRISVRAAPGASRDELAGVHGEALKVRVTAAPEKGKANQAILRLLARSLGLPRSRVVLLSGETSRDKSVLILEARLEEVERALRQCLDCKADG